MLDRIIRHSIEKNSRHGGRNKCPNPIAIPCWEAIMPEKVDKINPYRIKGLSYIQLEENSRCFGAVKLPRKIPNAHEVVLDAALIDENILSTRHN
jgi:hypothetical protein